MRNQTIVRHFNPIYLPDFEHVPDFGSIQCFSKDNKK